MSYLFWAALLVSTCVSAATTTAPKPLPAFGPFLAGSATREEAIGKALAARFPEGVKSAIDNRAGRLDGLPFRWIDNEGVENMGVASYTRDGVPRIMKITQHIVGWDGPEYDPERTAETQLRGALLGEVFDGPRMLRAGDVSRDHPPHYHFIEMEELFPGGGGASLKELVLRDRRYGDADFSRFRLAPPGGRSATSEMAGKLAETFEHGVVPWDADFYAARDGRVSWIDTTRWERPVASDETLAGMARQVRATLAMLGKDAGTGAAFFRDFMAVLRGSSLGEDFKKALLRSAFGETWMGRLLKNIGMVKSEDADPVETAFRHYGKP